MIRNSSLNEARSRPMKYWEIIADNLHKAGWSLSWVSALDSQGRTIWIVDAHGYGKRFIVRADEKLPAFRELESAIRLATTLVTVENLITFSSRSASASHFRRMSRELHRGHLRSAHKSGPAVLSVI